MANVVLNDANLTNIANAIREKNGETTQYKPSEMAAAITNLPSGGGGGYEPTDKELTIKCQSSNNNSTNGDGSVFYDGNLLWLLREYSGRVKIYADAYLQYLFGKFPNEVFDVNVTITSGTQYFPMARMFHSSSNLKEIIGSISLEKNTPMFNAYQAFYNCQKLRKINDNFIDTSKLYWYKIASGDLNQFGVFFANCYSLREIPRFFYDLFKDQNGNNIIASSSSYWYYYMFNNCYTLNKIEGLPVIVANHSDGVQTTNKFSGAFDNCHNLHKLTFKTNPDGTPIVAKWNKQTIDLTKYVGYAQYNYNMTDYNSGMTANDKVESPAVSDDLDNFQYLIGDNLTSKYTVYSSDSKYGHTEAVETINSLPDTSAAGGGNTIKFNGSQGFYTDYMRGRTDNKTFDSSISKLTEEEIAVAAAKGWTVSIS